MTRINNKLFHIKYKFTVSIHLEIKQSLGFSIDVKNDG